MLKQGFRIALVAAAGVVAIPALLVASDRSAAVANTRPVIGDERRSLEGLRREAAALLADRRYAAAAVDARRVIMRQPLDRSALQLLSRAEEGLGHQDQADDLAIAATFVSWRDPFAELQMFLMSMAGGRLDDAARRADAISRVYGVRAMGFRALNTLISQPGGASAVATRLATRPPWRDEYFRRAPIGIAAAPHQIPLLLKAMARTAAPASPTEENQALATMVARGLAPEAWAYWRSTRRIGTSALVDDPDLQEARIIPQGELSPPFVWSMPADTLVRLIDHRDATGHPALRIEARDDRSGFFVSRRVIVTPGRYRLSYQVEGDATQRERLHPELLCSDTVAIRVQPEGGPDSTTSTFEVPDGCPLLKLGFTVEPGESAAASELSIRGISLTRL